MMRANLSYTLFPQEKKFETCGASDDSCEYKTGFMGAE